MKRDDCLNTCAKLFGRLTHEIRALNAVGRFDINSVTEDFLIPIIKIVFNCPDLQNQNEIQQNFPSIDLGCRSSRISFQITTDASSEKITKTLDKFREHELHKHFDRVFVLTIAGKQSSYNAKALKESASKLPVAFDPSTDVIDIGDVLTRMKGLETDKLEHIATYLTSEFAKYDGHLRFRDDLDKFLEFSRQKIDFEKNSKKYIPAVFVETHSIKEEMRFFANPLFFCRKLKDSIGKINYYRLNEMLRLAKEPEFALEIEHEIFNKFPSTHSELDAWMTTLGREIDRELQKIGPLSWNYGERRERYKPANESSAAWSIARYRIESIASGLVLRLKDAKRMLTLMQKKIFLITSMAGQGKTNFVCDLIETQFSVFEIPCVFVPARELNSYPYRQRLLGYMSNNRYAPKFTKIHEYLDFFDGIAKEYGRPFLITIDGINEVTALEEFSDELKDFCAAVCQYELVKVIITCRSEFFEGKYSSLLTEPFNVQVHRVKDLRSEMSDATKERLLDSYLMHFQITGRVVGAASNFLQNDLLLLRIFCERHQAQEVGHVSDIYKGDLFEEFLLRKIQSFPEYMRGNVLPTLFKIVNGMLARDDYSVISVKEFAPEEKEVIFSLVAEDVILRQEIDLSSLMNVGEILISFTYDELRDFVIAYNLTDRVAGGAAGDLQETLARLKGRPIYEGVFKYVYLLARKTNRVAVVEACEHADDFLDHFALNAHLLPPAAQNSGDVARVRALLADISAPERVRAATVFLVGRRKLEELLNIGILIEHINSLEDAEHERFAEIIFSNPSDFGSENWYRHIEKFIESVIGASGEAGLNRRTPQWLAFFLHIAVYASWSQRERVGQLLTGAGSEARRRQVMELLSAAECQAVHDLLSEMADTEIAARA